MPATGNSYKRSISQNEKEQFADVIKANSPDFMNNCETFEAARFILENSLEMEHYKVISYRRPSPRVGGGAVILYTEHYIILNNGILKSNSSILPRSEGYITQYTP